MVVAVPPIVAQIVILWLRDSRKILTCLLYLMMYVVVLYSFLIFTFTLYIISYMRAMKMY
jgi:hypothetical protein